MSKKNTIVVALASAFGMGLGWKKRSPHPQPEVSAEPIRPYRAERLTTDEPGRKAAAANRRTRQKAKRAEQARRQREGMEQ
ncbi:hypothetical protein QO259_05480 [Salinicola sp. JS01]|uniref:hypothetical protein n=1 Tax=Salinicola sp. JS01 TaxID=3050071 RepID=UPI00255BA2AC|nr:hypothetical protein [Salinicola sp. JS01]WIX34113.1 hypothetical protein QO259_05480 [Salinicola sp. JS01]